MANGKYHVPWPARTVSIGDQMFQVDRGVVELPLSVGAQVEGLRPVTDADATRIQGTAAAASSEAGSDAGDHTAKRKEAAAQQAAIVGDDLIAKVRADSSVESLQAVRALELENPKREGGRKGVLDAIDARIKELTASQP